jgi:hypothetical protein
MDRRKFINAVAGGLAILRSVAGAQQAARIPRIGYLAGNLSAGQHFAAAFREGLRDLGYVEGRNVVIEYDGERPSRLDGSGQREGSRACKSRANRGRGAFCESPAACASGVPARGNRVSFKRFA